MCHSDLDDRAIEALKEFNEEGALQVLLQFKDSDLSHVQVCLAVLTYTECSNESYDLCIVIYSITQVDSCTLVLLLNDFSEQSM